MKDSVLDAEQMVHIQLLTNELFVAGIHSQISQCSRRSFHYTLMFIGQEVGDGRKSLLLTQSRANVSTILEINTWKEVEQITNGGKLVS